VNRSSFSGREHRKKQVFFRGKPSIEISTRQKGKSPPQLHPCPDAKKKKKKKRKHPTKQSKLFRLLTCVQVIMQSNGRHHGSHRNVFINVILHLVIVNPWVIKILPCFFANKMPVFKKMETPGCVLKYFSQSGN